MINQFIDRKTYAFVGLWKSPSNDREEKIFYYFKEPMTFIPIYTNGRQQIVMTATIQVFGDHNMVTNDLIKLQSGDTLKINKIVRNPRERNPLIHDLCKTEILDMTVWLQ